MTITYRSIASNLLITATAMSAAFQLYRASLGTPHDVDRFGPDAAAAYGCFFVVAVIVRSDRAWVWAATALLLVAVLVYGVTVYFPTVHATRPMGLLDWVEGTLYTGLLLAALACSLLRLTGTTIAPSGTGVISAPGSAVAAAHEAANRPASTRPTGMR